jgi:NTP pyrophosphatase (non-canonical NTP hydrolase)
MRTAQDEALVSQPATLEQLQYAVHANAVAHGFWDDPNNIDRSLMLITGELVEMHEAIRSGHAPEEWWIGVHGKPDGPAIELADALIRILDLAEHYGINLATLAWIKHQYNTSRPYKHGREF